MGCRVQAAEYDAGVDVYGAGVFMAGHGADAIEQLRGLAGGAVSVAVDLDPMPYTIYGKIWKRSRRPFISIVRSTVG